MQLAACPPCVLVMRRAKLEEVHQQKGDERVDHRRRRQAATDGDLFGSGGYKISGKEHYGYDVPVRVSIPEASPSYVQRSTV